MGRSGAKPRITAILIGALAFLIGPGVQTAYPQSTTVMPPNMVMANPPSPPLKHARHAKSRLPASESFISAAQAQASCPSDQVVWANLASRIYHASGSRYYGKTKHGAYACAAAAKAAGFKASRV
ncbi:MAG: hypothetical protein POH28_11410 [Acidocella sp.]|nr:hypothetical protein [Acidocella sp.]